MSHPPITSAEIVRRICRGRSYATVATAVNELVHAPDTTPEELEHALSKESRLTELVLRMANSNHLAVPGKMTSVPQVVAFLGYDGLAEITTQLALLHSVWVSTDRHTLVIARHLVAVGACAEAIARHLGHLHPGQAFLAGLCHDLGQLALAQLEPDRHRQAMEWVQQQHLSVTEAERKAGLPAHDEVGVGLLSRWRMPGYLGACAEFHHLSPPRRAQISLSPSWAERLQVVAAADELCQQFQLGNDFSATASDAEPTRLAQSLRDNREVLEEVRAATLRRLSAAQPLLDAITGPTTHLGE